MWKVDDSRIACWYFRYVLNCVQLFETLWTVAHQAPLSMGFFRQEYWRYPPPGDHPDPGIEPRSLTSPELPDGNIRFFTTSTTREAQIILLCPLSVSVIAKCSLK